MSSNDVIHPCGSDVLSSSVHKLQVVEGDNNNTTLLVSSDTSSVTSATSLDACVVGVVE